MHTKIQLLKIFMKDGKKFAFQVEIDEPKEQFIKSLKKIGQFTQEGITLDLKDAINIELVDYNEPLYNYDEEVDHLYGSITTDQRG